MKKNIKLPEKQSALLRLAVKDAQVIEKNKNYKFDMGEWHLPKFDNTGKPTGKCTVCLAGAVIANTLKVSPKVEKNPYDLEYEGHRDTCLKLRKIDELRGGTIYYTGEDDDRMEAVETAANLISFNYSDHLGRAPWKIYLKAADILESVGL